MEGVESPHPGPVSATVALCWSFKGNATEHLAGRAVRGEYLLEEVVAQSNSRREIKALNLPQLSILLEAIGSILVAFDILVPRSWRKTLDTAVGSWVGSGTQPRGAIAGTVVSVLIVIGWAVMTDLQSNQANANTVTSITLMLAGTCGGIAVPFMVTRFVIRVFDIAGLVFHMPAKADRGIVVYFVALAVTIAGVYIFASAAALSLFSLVSFLVTFIITAAFLSAWINAVPILQRFLSFQSGAVSRIGILVFIAAKIMQYGLA